MTKYSIDLGSPEQAKHVEQLLNADVEGGVYAEVNGSEVLLTVSPLVTAIGTAVTWLSLALIRLYDGLTGERIAYRNKTTV
jgi:hypothetical protein